MSHSWVRLSSTSRAKRALHCEQTSLPLEEVYSLLHFADKPSVLISGFPYREEAGVGFGKPGEEAGSSASPQRPPEANPLLSALRYYNATWILLQEAEHLPERKALSSPMGRLQCSL
ncbi:hypothetical protein Anapl_00754 [Anas platyrhynchos]|uniref:Uncharacterized protein n=1 Tax=Anas platyrhynchos TaxID=8839 RepID=R0JSS2_ANAPL|nr:hypothetical protein Anapl_00754 [Anas platyrhynchos]